MQQQKTHFVLKTKTCDNRKKNSINIQPINHPSRPLHSPQQKHVKRQTEPTEENKLTFVNAPLLKLKKRKSLIPSPFVIWNSPMLPPELRIMLTISSPRFSSLLNSAQIPVLPLTHFLFKMELMAEATELIPLIMYGA